MIRKMITRWALGLSVIGAALAVAAPAKADQRRLRNANTQQGTFYLGIPPGVQNNHVQLNQGLVTWQSGQDDQVWEVPSGGGQFVNAKRAYESNGSEVSVCIGVEGGMGAGPGARVISEKCDDSAHPEQYWQMIPSTSVGLGGQYPNCFIMWNPYTSKAMGVTNGDVRNGGTVILWNYDGTSNQFWCK